AGGVPARAVGVVPVQAGADAGEQRAGRLLAVTGLEVPRGGGVHVAEGQVLAAGNPVDVGEIVVPVGDGPAGGDELAGIDHEILGALRVLVHRAAGGLAQCARGAGIVAEAVQVLGVL